jgi:hypothetical protein
MSLTAEAKAKLVMDAIKEDRHEIRLARERIYTTATYITAGSFAITAYLVGDKLPNFAISKTSNILILILIDASLLVALWGLFLRFMADLIGGQLILEKRERMLFEVQRDGEVEPLDIFKQVIDPEKKEQPAIRHPQIRWVVIAVSGAILFKLGTLVWLARAMPRMQ